MWTDIDARCATPFIGGSSTAAGVFALPRMPIGRISAWIRTGSRDLDDIEECFVALVEGWLDRGDADRRATGG